MKKYCDNLLERSRFLTRKVHIGNVSVGGDEPVRVQSMTTADTMDTTACVEESIRMIDAGCEIVRLTAPSKKEAENLRNIKAELIKRGYETPLVADIHFTPNAAEVAAEYVEKVRVNPGNYADKKRFEDLEYTDESYQQELARIEEKFVPLVLKCKERGVAMRIGTNHGSLSDRILSRYGDTPEGMVESAMEFVRMCRKHDYHELVLSMKASNTLVMVEAYRLLVAVMKENGMNYPLHLGVTEAGDGEDGRIKSAVGIGTLLEDGIGDTIRVSLTEDSEKEIPVANKLLEKYAVENQRILPIKYRDAQDDLPYDPFDYHHFHSHRIDIIGDGQHPVVIGDVSEHKELKPSHLFAWGYAYSIPLDKWNISDAAADYIYIGNQTLSFEKPGALRILCDVEVWKNNYAHEPGFYPVGTTLELETLDVHQVSFVRMKAGEESLDFLRTHPNSVVLWECSHSNHVQLFRLFQLNVAENNLKTPTILVSAPQTEDPERYQLWISSEIGAILIDGFGDGIMPAGSVSAQLKNSTAFGILQATRTRISKTEYISCPSCGRTLFDLQETTARIREKTSHLKGVKIGIMGCIVNGPGEMADADYGYVGTGPGKIHLYKEKEVMRKNVSEKEAVDALIELIKEHGDWVDPA